MDNIYIEDQTFDGVNFSINALPLGQYEQCKFNNCELSYATLTNYKFVDCEFKECNFSLATLTNTIFRNVSFKACKMLGLHFNDCNEFGLTFDFNNCTLNHSTFFKTKIKKTVFKDSMLHEVDFTACDLSGAVFEKCDLFNAKFDQSILEKCDFRFAHNFVIDPSINRIKKAKFSVNGLPGLLQQYDIIIENS